MNNVSWFLYAAGALDKLESLCFVVLIFGGVGLLFLWIFVFAEEQKKTVPAVLTALYALTAFTVVVIPSKTTMYAIAAAQIGETVVTSAEAREMIDDSKQILREYLKSLKKDAGK